MNRFKKYAYFIIILICLALFSSCQNNTIKNVPTEIIMDDGTGILAENDAVDFYFYYPENFIMQRNDAMITIYVNDQDILQTNIQEPDSGEYFSNMTKPNLSATVVDPSKIYGVPAGGEYQTIDEYWKNVVLISYEEIFQDIEIVSEEDMTMGNDNDISARKYTYTLSLSGMKFKISEIVFSKKGKIYNLTYTATENKYETYAHILTTAAETFKFK